MKVEKLKGVWQCQCDETNLLVTARADGGAQLLFYGFFTDVPLSVSLGREEVSSIVGLTDAAVSVAEDLSGGRLIFTPSNRGEPYRKGFDVDVRPAEAEFETHLLFLSSRDHQSLVAFLGRLRHVDKEVNPMEQANSNTAPSWRRPRPPLHRLCTLRVTCAVWPDSGRGVWETYGYANLETQNELVQLRRVMPAEQGGRTGELIWLWRATFDAGNVNVWRAGGDLSDPDFARDEPGKLAWAAEAKPSAQMQVLDLAALVRRLVEALAPREPNASILAHARRYLSRHGLLEDPSAGPANDAALEQSSGTSDSAEV